MLFVQAAKVILMRPENWHKFSFGAWLEAASTRMQHNKLGIALANKLARIAWSVLSSGKNFDWKEKRDASCGLIGSMQPTMFVNLTHMERNSNAPKV